MRVAKDIFLVQVDNAKNSTLDIVGSSGKKLLIDTDYNKFKHSTRVGKVFALPIMLTPQYIYDVPLNIGDEVMFHHFVCQPKNKIEIYDNVYRADYFNVYAKIVDDMIEPLEDIIFVDPIKEKEEDLFCGVIKVRTKLDVVKQQGIVFASSRKARAWGILPGDKVHFSRNADYEMKLVDKVLYRMKIRNILCVERDGVPVCLQDKILVKLRKDYKVNDNLFQDKEEYQLEGEVIDFGGKANCVSKGDIVNFFSTIHGGVDLYGEQYHFLEPRHINYIKN